MSADLPTPKEPAVETLDGILSTLDLVELEVDVALGVGIKGNVDDFAVFLGAFCTDVVFEFFDPGVTAFPLK